MTKVTHSCKRAEEVNNGKLYPVLKGVGKTGLLEFFFFHILLVSDYVQCPYCQRTFNQHAGERHIKFCQEQAARMPRKGKLADEKKPPARTQVALIGNFPFSLLCCFHQK